MTRRPSPLALWVAVFLPMACLFLLTATWDEADLSPDPVAAAMSAWSVAEDGDLDLTADEQRNAWVFEVEGRFVSNRQPGVIAVGVPFYVLSRPFTDGFSLFPMALAAAVITAAAVATFALVLVRIGATPRAAGGFAVVGALATATWSVSADALWTHGPDQLLLLTALLFLSHRWYWAAGLALGAAVTVRTHLAVVALTLGVAALVHTRRLRPFVLIGLGSTLGLAAVFLYTAVVFGEWSPNAGYTATGGYPTAQLAESSLRTTLDNLLGALLNPNRGLLLTSPVLLGLLPAAIRCWRQAEWWARGAAAGGLLYTLVQCRLNGFSGGTYFWGSRLTLELLTLLAPLLWMAWRTSTLRSSDALAGLRALAVLSIAIQAVGQFVERPVVSDSWTTWFVREEAFGVAHSNIVRATMALAVVLALASLWEGRYRRARSICLGSAPAATSRNRGKVPEQRGGAIGATPASLSATELGPSSGAPGQPPGAAASTLR